ncbi:hypothetical protein R1A27_16255 [Methylobacterium sp. NMS12]
MAGLVRPLSAQCLVALAHGPAKFELSHDLPGERLEILDLRRLQPPG